MLEKHRDKINWDNLSLYSNAIYLLEENPDKINWDNLQKQLIFLRKIY
jgi:hypothetical protein